jgi:malate dehydrogenase (oxaloacetate-decarboxylating)
MVSDPLEVHRRLRGKIFIGPKAEIRSIEDLATLYTPGVAKPCLEIARDKSLVYDYTMKSNAVAIVSDGTRVLGLGDIGPEAALPVMEGKALIMQQFAGIDAFPIVLDTKDAEEIIRTVRAISPGFGAINLEDIESPKVFYIEKRLTEELGIPVFHDDQHGTAIVALAGLYNALEVTGRKDPSSVRIGIVGAGSAGYAIAKLLNAAGFSDIVVFDSRGAISGARSDLEEYKAVLSSFNSSNFTGPLSSFMGADAIISASKPGSIPVETIKSMRKPNIVFALSNPVPELSLEEARELGVDVFGTGRSDYPNQINNSLCFPGFLRTLLDLRVRKITDRMKIAAARGIADAVGNPTRERIVPDVFDKRVVGLIRKSVEGAL